jgi:arginine decarboxylase
MVAPTPGIPIIIPGERFIPESGSIIEYLKYTSEFDRLFPSFENEIHGLRIRESSSGKRDMIDYVKE